MTKKMLRLSALGLFLGTTTLLRAAIAPAENLLPADTLAFITVPDCNAFRTACKTSPQLMFWNVSAMKPFHDKFMAKFNEKFIAPMEKELGIKTDDFASVLQGQFTFGVTVNGSNGHDDVPPGIVLLLDAKDKSGVLKTNLAALTKKWTDASRSLRTEKIHGLNFTVVVLASNDLASIFPKRASAKDSKVAPTEIFFAQYESLLVAGNSAKVMESVAARLTGGSVPAIADDPGFNADKLSQFRDSPLNYGWFNAGKFFALLMAEPKTADDSDAFMAPKFTAAKILEVTGLGSLKSASFAVREQADGSSATFHLTVPESSRSGLVKMLALPAKDAGVPAFVPADAIKFTRIRLDGKEAWNEIQKMVAGISPQYSSSLNSVIDIANTMAQTKNPAFDIRSYLFDNLGDDLIIYQKAPKDETVAAMANPPATYLLKVANADQAIDAIKTLAGMGAPQDSATKPREFLGRKIYSVVLRPTRGPGGEVEPNSLFLTSSGGYLAISKDTAIIEEYLRSAEGKIKPLREQAGLAEAASHVGTSGGLFSYENQRDTMRSAFKLLKASGSASNPLQMLPPAFRDWTDFSLLPEYDLVSKFFYLTVSGTSVNGEGLTLKVFTPRSPQLK